MHVVFGGGQIGFGFVQHDVVRVFLLHDLIVHCQRTERCDGSDSILFHSAVHLDLAGGDGVADILVGLFQKFDQCTVQAF